MQVWWWYKLLDFLRVQWRKYKTTFCWFLVCLVIGIILGIITLYLGDVGVDNINYRLIDGNLLNATSIDSSLGNFVWQRILSLALPIIVVLILATISKLTALAVFPMVLMHGYWLAVAVWWTFFYYNLTAILVLVFYIVWLLIVTLVLFAGLLWALQCGENFRQSGGKTNCPPTRNWGVFWRGVALIVGVAVVMGFLEYLVFWTILGKIVYKPR